MAQMLKFDGSSEMVTPSDTKSGFQLDELYALLECEIVETVYLEDGTIMVIDEEGKFRADALARRNERATRLLHRAGGIAWDFITGHALICSEEEFQ